MVSYNQKKQNKEVILMANYKVNNTAKTIRAIVSELTEKELNAVNNFLKLGYKLKPVESLEKKDSKESVSKFSAKEVQKYLEEHGTEEQKERYWKAYNKPVMDKETGKQKKYTKTTDSHKEGELKVAGHIAGLQEFKKDFPDYGKDND